MAAIANFALSASLTGGDMLGAVVRQHAQHPIEQLARRIGRRFDGDRLRRALQ
jgi:hypothetical protein